LISITSSPVQATAEAVPDRHIPAFHRAGPGALTRRGWKKGDVKIGDTLIVDGYPAKDNSHLMDARRALPDGRIVSGGSAGDGGPGDADSLTAVDPAKAKK
jgi:hypothetical protein